MTAAPTRVRELSRERLLEFADSRPSGEREALLELAGRWKHGWIPLDAIAAAIKAKRMKGDGHRRADANLGAIARPRGKSRLDARGAAQHAAVVNGARAKGRGPQAGRRPAVPGQAGDRTAPEPNLSARAAEAVRLKAPELRDRAAKGDKVAKAELERRAAKRAGKATVDRQAGEALHARYDAAKTPAEKHAAAAELAGHYKAAGKATPAKNWQRTADKHAADLGAGTQRRYGAEGSGDVQSIRRAAGEGPHTAAVAGVGDGAATPAGMPTISREDAMRRLAASYTHTELARELKRAKEGSTAHKVLHEEGVRRLQQAEHPDAPPRDPVGKPKRKPSALHEEYRRLREEQDRRFEAHAGGGVAAKDTHTQEYKDYFGVGDHSTSPQEERLTFKSFLEQRRAGNEYERRQQHAYDAGMKLGARHGQQEDSSGHEAEYRQHEAAHGSDGAEMFGQGYSDGIIAGSKAAEDKRAAAEAKAKDDAFQTARDHAGAASMVANRDNTAEAHKAAVLAHAQAGQAALAAGRREAARHHIAEAGKHKDAHAERAKLEAEHADAGKVNERLRAESIARGDARTPEEKAAQARDLNRGIRVEDSRHDTPEDWRAVAASRWTTPRQKEVANRKLAEHAATEHNREYAKIANGPLSKMSNAELAKFVQDNPLHKSNMSTAQKRAVAQFLRERAASARVQNAHESTQRQHVAARERINPSSADISAAAERWKAEHPGQPVRGHEKEVNALAERIASDKFVRTGTRSSNTPEESAAERQRVKDTMARDSAHKRDTAGRLAAESRGRETPEQVAARIGMTFPKPTVKGHAVIGEGTVEKSGTAYTAGHAAELNRRLAEQSTAALEATRKARAIARQGTEKDRQGIPGPHGEQYGEPVTLHNDGVAGDRRAVYLGRDINGQPQYRGPVNGQMHTVSISEGSYDRIRPDHAPTSSGSSLLAGRSGDYNAIAAMNTRRTPEERQRLADNIQASHDRRIAMDRAAYPVGTRVAVGHQQHPAEVVSHHAGGIKVRFESGRETHVSQDSLKPLGDPRRAVTGPDRHDELAKGIGATPRDVQTFTQAANDLHAHGFKLGDTVEHTGDARGSRKAGQWKITGLTRNGNVRVQDTQYGTHVDMRPAEMRKVGGEPIRLEGNQAVTITGPNAGQVREGSSSASAGSAVEQSRAFGQAANSGQRANIGQAQAEARKAAQGPPVQGEMFSGHGQHQPDMFDQVPSSSAPAAPSPAAGASGIRVEHSGDGTVVYGTEKGDTEATQALKAQGFKWSRSLGGWYLPRTWNESTREVRVRGLQARLGDRVSVQRGELARSGTAAERAQAQADRAKEIADQQRARAERFRAESDAQHEAARRISDHIPMGQPILVGHHSEARHRRDLERIHARDRKAHEAHVASRQAESRASSADARARQLGDPRAAARRLERNEAELRSVERKLNGTGKEIHGENAPATGEYADRLRARHQELTQQIEHDRGVAGDLVGPEARYGKHNVQPGDVVRVGGRDHIVHSVGPKNAKLMTEVGPLPYAYSQVQGLGKLEDASSDTLKRMLANSDRIGSYGASRRQLPAAVTDRIRSILRARGEA